MERIEGNNMNDKDGKGEDGGGFVVLRSGQRIKYEYLVVATGSVAGLPSRVGREDKADGIQLFREMQDRIQAAKDVVVLGGGPAGVEIAADAKALYPEKNVTLLHSQKRLMNASFGPKMHEVAVKELEKLGVNLVLGERAQIPDDTETVGEIILNSGKRIPYDCLVRSSYSIPVSREFNSDKGLIHPDQMHRPKTQLRPHRGALSLLDLRIRLHQSPPDAADRRRSAREHLRHRRRRGHGINQERARSGGAGAVRGGEHRACHQGQEVVEVSSAVV